MPDFPTHVDIAPCGPVDAEVLVPGSKSLTNRALVAAALGDGTSTLRNAAFCDDSELLCRALSALGFSVRADPAAATIRVTGAGGLIPARRARLFVGNAGTALRFLVAMTALGNGAFTIDGDARLRQRPVAELLAALRALGADARDTLGTGCPPVRIRASGLAGGRCAVAADRSSQFLSALLLAAPCARAQVIVEVAGPVASEPYVAMTRAVMRAFGVEVPPGDGRTFAVPRAGAYAATEYTIEPDASGATYFMSLAAVTGGRIRLPGLRADSVQGDVAFADLLETMGCTVDRGTDAIEVRGGPLKGIDADLNRWPDAAPALAATALFARGETRIRGVAHLRLKESDRIAALAAELRKFGAAVVELPDGLTIHPPQRPAAAEVATYRDHRMVMAFAVAGCAVPGTRVADPACVRKSQPRFFDLLRRATAAR